MKECGITGRSYTFSKIGDGILRLTGVLQKLGVSQGDVVSIVMVNSPEYIMAFFGSSATGAAVSNINPAFTPGIIMLFIY